MAGQQRTLAQLRWAHKQEISKLGSQTGKRRAMSQILEGGRTTNSTLRRREPTWSILTAILALAVGIAVGMYHWQRDHNGLQRWYFTSYVRSAVSESRSFQIKGLSQYRIIDLVDDRHPEQTLTTVTNEDAAVTVNKDGTLTLEYAEKWAHRPHLRAVIRKIALDNDVMHGWLQEQVYGLQGIRDLLKWPVESGALAAGVVLLAGLLFAIPADRRRAEQRRVSLAEDYRGH
jgi:hypothetical protein